MKTDVKARLGAVRTPHRLCIYLVQALTTFTLWSLEGRSQGSRRSRPASEHTSPGSPDGLKLLPREVLCSELTQGVADGANFYSGKWETLILNCQNFPFEVIQMCSLKRRWDSLYQVSQPTFNHGREWIPLILKQKLLLMGAGRGKESGMEAACGVWLGKGPAHRESTVCPPTLPSCGWMPNAWCWGRKRVKD